ncbi:hypothetical protein BV898_16238 [Hypsibius exemplaris]|uniref:Chromo domain-containing protein n=1 Tax=Hypsibius exemplaris TaxID=2072580 RepID=A0A9X6RLA2_HYPEX|nr:hypothetical protein BV898_16238 [Hypsibius exemplaris]
MATASTPGKGTTVENMTIREVEAFGGTRVINQIQVKRKGFPDWIWINVEDLAYIPKGPAGETPATATPALFTSSLSSTSSTSTSSSSVVRAPQMAPRNAAAEVPASKASSSRPDVQASPSSSEGSAFDTVASILHASSSCGSNSSLGESSSLDTPTKKRRVAQTRKSDMGSSRRSKAEIEATYARGRRHSRQAPTSSVKVSQQQRRSSNDRESAKRKESIVAATTGLDRDGLVTPSQRRVQPIRMRSLSFTDADISIGEGGSDTPKEVSASAVKDTPVASTPNKSPSTEESGKKTGPAEPEVFEVERILGCTRVGSRIHYLVKWLGYGPEENSWEDWNSLKGARESVEKFVQIHGKTSAVKLKVLSAEGIAWEATYKHKK